MKLIHSYILRIFTRSLVISIFAAVSLFLAVDFSERLDDLMSASIPPDAIVRYFLMKIPSMIKDVIIPVTAIAIFITYGIMFHRKEIMALHALGIPPRRYWKALVVSGIILSAGYFVFVEYIERPIKADVIRFWNERVKKTSDLQSLARRTKKGEIWYATRNAIYHIGYYDARTQTFYRVSISFVDDRFRLYRKVEAAKMIWEENGWVATNATVLDIGETISLRKIPVLPIEIKESPSDFSAFQTAPEELSIGTIIRVISLMSEEGVNSRSYVTELHSRFANAVFFAVSIFLMVSIMSRCEGISFRSEIKTGLLALTGFATFYGMFQLGTGLSSSGILPPIAGIWGSHLSAVIISVKLLFIPTGKSAKKRSFSGIS